MADYQLRLGSGSKRFFFVDLDVIYLPTIHVDKSYIPTCLPNAVNVMLWSHFAFQQQEKLTNPYKNNRFLAPLVRRRMVPLARESQPHFLEFRRKPSSKLDTHSAGFGVWSDWLDLNNHCVQTGMSPERMRSRCEGL